MSFDDTSLAMLVMKEPLTEAEWLQIIEIRRSLIKTYFDFFTLPALGKLECVLREGVHGHALEDDNPVVKGIPLDTQGIFNCVYKTCHYLPGGNPNWKSGYRLLWGLTRKGEWVLGTVHFKGERGYKDRGYERATIVSVHPSTSKEIIEKTQQAPIDIWIVLGEAVKEWEQHRRRSYELAQHLLHTVEAEETALSLITR